MKKIVLGIVFLLALGLTIYSCGSDTSGDPSAGGADGMTGIVNYAGPGSVQKLTLDNDAGTFVFTEAVDATTDPTLTVSGTFVRLDSGFIKLTVTSVVGDGPDVGLIAYGFEIPGMAFLLRPMDGESQIMPLVMTGYCPSSDMTANWIKVKNYDEADASVSCNAGEGASDWAGTFSYTQSTGVVTLPARYSLAADYDLCTATDEGIPAGTTATCSEGIMEFTVESELIRIFITELGGGIVQISANSETDQQHIVAFPVQEITQTDLAGDYFGLAFSGSDGDTFPVGGTINATGTVMTGAEMTDPEAGTLSSPPYTFTFGTVNSPSNGFIKVTGPSSTKMLCQAATNVGPSANKKNIINCVSQDFGGDPSYYFNILLVSE